MNTEKIKQQVKLKVVQQLYLHAYSAVFSTLFSSVMVVVVFYSIVKPQTLFVWASVSSAYLLFRFFFTHAALKKQITLENLDQRLRQFTISICFSGIIFGAAGILFLSPEQPAYNAFIFFLMGGGVAGSLGAFAINKRAFFVFSAPTILPVTIHSFILGGKINTSMAILGLVFITLMISVVRGMNVTIEGAVQLGIENTILAEDTKRLNAELMNSNEKFQDLSYKDTLTNISNRRFLSEVFNHEIDRFAFSLSLTNSGNSAIAQLIYGIFIVDIDHFKNVNDTWGHKCGDDVIIQFVKVLQSHIRKDDIICRWGGEEFVIILKRTDPTYIRTFSLKVIQAVANFQFRLNDKLTINKTCSLGYAQFPFIENFPQLLSLDKTIEIADQALYYAKENGRNMAVKALLNFSGNRKISLEEAEMIVKDIPKAIEDNFIEVFESV